MDPATAPAAGIVQNVWVQAAFLGLFVLLLGFVAWSLYKVVRELRTENATLNASLLAQAERYAGKLLELTTAQITADRDSAAAFNALRDVLNARKP